MMTIPIGPFTFDDPDHDDLGPWMIGDAAHNDVAEVYSEENATVKITRETSIATARLFVSAPDMLKALTDIAQGNVPAGFLEPTFNNQETPAQFKERFCTWMQSTARAAIAKATKPE